MDQKRPMTRLLLLPIALLAGACGDSGSEELPASSELVECAIDGAKQFERTCSIERMVGADGLVLTIRSPSGSFRRLLVTKDGRGVVAADGAEQAVVAPAGPDRIEVTVGPDRYRLPATVRQ
jgi:hypothetical protein